MCGAIVVVGVMTLSSHAIFMPKNGKVPLLSDPRLDIYYLMEK